MLPHNLRPSLDVACSAVGDEIAELQARGERVVDMYGYRHPNGTRAQSCVWIATNSTHEHGVAIFGFTDEETR